MAVYAPPREIVPIWNKINFAHSDVGATEDWCLLNFLGLNGGQISGSLIVIQNTRLNTLIATTITTSNLYATTISSSTINTALLNATNIYNTTITTSNIFATTLTSSNIYSTTISASIDINTALLKATTISSGGTSNLLTINNSTLNTTTANIANALITGTTTMTGKLITTTQAIITQLGIGNNASTFSFTDSSASQLQIGSLNSGNVYGFSLAMSNVYARFRETAVANQLKIGTNMSTSGVQDNILYPSWSLYMGNDNFHINQARAGGSGGSETTVFAINNIACTIATTLNVSGYCNIGSLYCGNIACVAVSCSSIYASGNCLINGGFNVVGGCWFGSTLGVSGAINCGNILCTAVSCSTLYNSGAVVHASTVSIIGVLSTTNIISSSITNSTNISIGTSSTTSSGFIYLSDGSLLGVNPIRISNNNSLKTEYYNGTIWNQLMSVSSTGSIINSSLSVSGALYTSTGNITNIISTAITSSSSVYAPYIYATAFSCGGSSNLFTINNSTLNTASISSGGTATILNITSSAIVNSGNISIGTSSITSSGFIYLYDGLLGVNLIRISNRNSLKTEYYNGTIWNQLMSVSSAITTINSNLTVVGALTASSITTAGAIACASVNSVGACSIATTLNIGGAVVCASTVGTGALTASNITTAGAIAGAGISGTSLSITGTVTFAGQLITTTQAIMTRIGIGNNPSTFAFTESYASELQIGSLNSGNDYGFSMAMANVYARYRETAVVNQLKIGTNMSTLGVQDNILFPSWSIYMGNDDLHINQARPNGAESTVFSINATTGTFNNSVYFGGGLKLPTSGGTATLLGYYEEAIVNTYIGPSGGGWLLSTTIYLIRIGKIVTMRLPTFTCDTFGNGYLTCSATYGIPARFRPAGPNSVSFSIPIINVGVYQYYPGQICIFSSGQFNIFMTAGGSGFFGSGAGSGLQTDVIVSWSIL